MARQNAVGGFSSVEYFLFCHKEYNLSDILVQECYSTCWERSAYTLGLVTKNRVSIKLPWIEVLDSM